jgi:hypothetical protein
MSPHRFRLLCTALIAAGAVAPGVARAVPSADELATARDLFTRAEQDEDAGRWEDARAKLQKVAGVRLTAGIRYHLALCDEHLGRLATALTGFTAAQEDAVSENAQDVLRLVGAEMAPLVGRVPRLSLRVSPAVAETKITLDGAVRAEPVGATLLLDPGVHRVEATAPGRASAPRVVTMKEGDVTFLDVVMAPTADGTSGAGDGEAPGPLHPIPGANAALAAQAPSAGSDRSSGAHLPVAPILTTALALALAGVGVGAYLAADGAHAHAVSACAGDVTTAADACDPLKSAVRNWDGIAVAAWAGAAASATVSIVLWTGKPSATTRATTGHLTLGPGAVSAGGSF